MANSRSANKRIKINERNRLRNRIYRGNIKNNIQIFLYSLKQYIISKKLSDKSRAQKVLQLIHSQIDKAVKKKVFHPNNATRKKVQLAVYLKKA